MKLILQIALGIIVAIVCLMLVCAVCTSNAIRKSLPTRNVDLDVKIIRFYQQGSYLTVQVKTVNNDSIHVNSVYATVTVIDKSGEEIAAESEYLVYAHKGGLNPGGSAFQDFIIPDISERNVKEVRVKVTQVE